MSGWSTRGKEAETRSGTSAKGSAICEGSLASAWAVGSAAVSGVSGADGFSEGGFARYRLRRAWSSSAKAWGNLSREPHRIWT
jgi:hypothetical protein